MVLVAGGRGRGMVLVAGGQGRGMVQWLEVEAGAWS